MGVAIKFVQISQQEASSIANFPDALRDLACISTTREEGKVKERGKCGITTFKGEEGGNGIPRIKSLSGMSPE